MTYDEWRGRLADANDEAFWPIEAIDRLLFEGEGQFWCDGNAALVTRITEFPGGARVLEAVAAAGDNDSLSGTIESACEAFARSQGLTHLYAGGRKGWEKVKQADGWRHFQSIMVRELR